jgi:hypothetical protein
VRIAAGGVPPHPVSALAPANKLKVAQAAFRHERIGPILAGRARQAPTIRSRNGPFMDGRSELESMRRSIAMLNPGSAALDREDAMDLLRELQDVERRLKPQDGMRKLLMNNDRGLWGLRWASSQ